MILAKMRHRHFRFRRPATTSRGTLCAKHVYYLLLYCHDNPSVLGIGECSVFPGLSVDDVEGFERKLLTIIERINDGSFPEGAAFDSWPSIKFAFETAMADLRQSGTKILYPSDFTRGKDSIPINGLIWMGSDDAMRRQFDRKLADGFRCVKLKIGALDFADELHLLKYIRARFREHELEIRLDANGAFTMADALEKLKRLSEFAIHSIEQPIAPRQPENMALLCDVTPIPIALDEELIGVCAIERKRALLATIRPQYIILKPGLLGGIAACQEWISAANESNIGWWITSSLETNIGLNAIAQWTYTLKSSLRQGLSTGMLYENNIDSPLTLASERLTYAPEKGWDISFFSSDCATHV